MGLYVEVRRSGTGLPITNATFSTWAFSNLGGGIYWLWAPVNSTVWVSASGHHTRTIYTDYYSKVWVYLPKKVPHSKSHSKGGGGWT